MLIRVRHALDGKEAVFNDVAKLTKIDDFRQWVAEKFNFPVEEVFLIGRGKILENGQTLFDYKLDDGLTINVQQRKQVQAVDEGASANSSTAPKNVKNSGNDDENFEEAESKFYSIGDLVDIFDEETRTYHEAKITKICKKRTPLAEHENLETPTEIGDDLFYFCRYERFPEEEETEFRLKFIRPRACEKVSIKRLMKDENCRNNMRFLINYNADSPGDLGEFYEATISYENRRLFANIYFVPEGYKTPIEQCKQDEIYILPEHRQKTSDTNEDTEDAPDEPMPLRTVVECKQCFDNPKRKQKCRYCTCNVCRGSDDGPLMLLCEECAEAYHTYCLTPKMESVPDDDWYCPECKNDDSAVVKPGEGNKLLTGHRQKMPSATAKREWGKKNSCDGVSKKCTIVPKNHFGPIPGVEVGTTWRFRKQVSEAGIHRPLVGGIHGRNEHGACSIVVSGGYEDDEDSGDLLLYTGSGGRDLSGNKRAAAQSSDQKLTQFNAALARNCYGSLKTLNPKGADAGSNWRKGIPLRVVRSAKGKNDYSPKEGYRYDGTYKVVEYWPEKGREGFVVWRYRIQRDDTTPAPWTKEGKKRIKEKGLDMVIEDESAENGLKVDTGEQSDSKKRDADDGQPLAQQVSPKQKRTKFLAYQIPKEHVDLIKLDDKNTTLWAECIAAAENGSSAFIEKISEAFQCALCCSILYRPVPLPCNHHFCLPCVVKNASYGFKFCCTCRHPNTIETEKDCEINENLSTALHTMIPGYAADREPKKEGRKKGGN